MVVMPAFHSRDPMSEFQLIPLLFTVCMTQQNFQCTTMKQVKREYFETTRFEKLPNKLVKKLKVSYTWDVLLCIIYVTLTADSL